MDDNAAQRAESPDAPKADLMDPQATLDAWRERGADRLDPVRFRFIEALARRAGLHEGETRRILDGKLARLIAAYGSELVKRSEGDDTGDAPGRIAPLNKKDTIPRRSALAALLEHISQQASPSHSPPELKTLRDFKSTWSRLSTNQRLKQSLAKVPGNAGPLNSHQLIHRSLTLMRDLSPDYLHRFMSYVDALSWVDQTQGAGSPPLAGPGSPPRAEIRGKPSRGKAG